MTMMISPIAATAARDLPAEKKQKISSCMMRENGQKNYLRFLGRKLPK